MRFSLFYNFDIMSGKSVPELYREIEQQVICADQLGFAAVWLAEHHFELYGRMPAPLLFLTRLSGLTNKIDLGTAVIEAPYYNPLRLAEDAALLDLLSGGRLRLGVGSGARNKTAEFERFSVSLEEKGPRTLEIVSVLQQALDSGLVDYSGEFYRFSGIEIQPRALRPAREVIWLAASESMISTASANGFGLLLPRVGPGAKHQELARRYRAGLDDKPGRVALLRFVYVAESEQQAQEQTRATITRYAKYDLNFDWDGRLDSAEYVDICGRLNALIGTPEQVSARLAQWQEETGFDEIMCQCFAAGMRHKDSLRSIQLIGREIMPRFSERAKNIGQLEEHLSVEQS